MKPILLTLALFAVLGTASAQSYPRDEIRRYDEREICRDNNGSYHWQVVEQRVWIPTQRVSNGVFGRTIPGHYETRRDRVRVYHDNNRYEKHGKKDMPYGQWKKHKKDRDDDRWQNNRNDRDRDNDRDRYYGRRD